MLAADGAWARREPREQVAQWDARLAPRLTAKAQGVGPHYYSPGLFRCRDLSRRIRGNVSAAVRATDSSADLALDDLRRTVLDSQSPLVVGCGVGRRCPVPRTCRRVAPSPPVRPTARGGTALESRRLT